MYDPTNGQLIKPRGIYSHRSWRWGRPIPTNRARWHSNHKLSDLLSSLSLCVCLAGWGSTPQHHDSVWDRVCLDSAAAGDDDIDLVWDLVALMLGLWRQTQISTRRHSPKFRIDSTLIDATRALQQQWFLRDEPWVRSKMLQAAAVMQFCGKVVIDLDCLFVFFPFLKKIFQIWLRTE